LDEHEIETISWMSVRGLHEDEKTCTARSCTNSNVTYLLL